MPSDWWDTTWSQDCAASDKLDFEHAKAEQWSVSTFVSFVSTNAARLRSEWVKRVFARLSNDIANSIPRAAAPTAVKKRLQVQSSDIRHFTTRSMDRFEVAVAWALTCAATSAPFRVVEHPTFREAYKATVTAQAPGGESVAVSGIQFLPSRKDVADALRAVHAYVVDECEKELRRAPGFSVMFDLWTSSKGTKESFIGVVFSFIDEHFAPRFVLLDVIPTGSRRHNVRVLSRLLGDSIAKHTTDDQFLYGAMTDNARNVVRTAQTLVAILNAADAEAVDADGDGDADGAEGNNAAAENDNDAIARDRSELEALERAAADADNGDDDDELDDLAADDENDDAIGIDQGVQVGPIHYDESQRAVQCIDHDLNLCVVDVMKTEQLRALVRNIDKIAVVMSRSPRLQQRLAELAVDDGSVPRKVVRRAPTRWNSVVDSIASVLYNRIWLLAMYVDREFEASRIEVRIPYTDLEIALLEGLQSVLETLKAATVVFETASYMTLPHVPFAIHELKSKLNAVETSDASTRELKAIARSLREAVERRMGKHFDGRCLPTIAAALLFPAYSWHELRTINVSADVCNNGVTYLIEWATALANAELENGAPDVRAAVAVVPDDDSMDMGDADAQQQVQPEMPEQLYARRVGAVRRLVSLLRNKRRENAGAAVGAAALSRLSTEHFAECQKSCQDFYSAAFDHDAAWLRVFVRLIFCQPASNAIVEQVFSGAGRINAPLRNRMSSQMIANLNLVQHFLRRPGADFARIRKAVMVFKK